MTITLEDFDLAVTSAENYEKTAMGLKFGPDFPEFANVLMASKKFSDILMGIGIGGMLSVLMIPKEGDTKKRGDAMMDDLKSNPLLRDNLALAFYVGFKLGQRSTEIDKLEGLTK